jgi:hypothetical protein
MEATAAPAGSLAPSTAASEFVGEFLARPLRRRCEAPRVGGSGCEEKKGEAEKVDSHSFVPVTGTFPEAVLLRKVRPFSASCYMLLA